MSDNYLATRDVTRRDVMPAWKAKHPPGLGEMKFSRRRDKFSYHLFSASSRCAKYVSFVIKSNPMLVLKIEIRCFHRLRGHGCDLVSADFQGGCDVMRAVIKLGQDTSEAD